MGFMGMMMDPRMYEGVSGPGQMQPQMQAQPGMMDVSQGGGMGGGFGGILAQLLGQAQQMQPSQGQYFNPGVQGQMQAMQGQPAPMPGMNPNWSPYVGQKINMGGMQGRIRNIGPSGRPQQYPGQYWKQGSVSWQAPSFSAAPSPGFSNFLGALYGRFGQPSAAYQGYLQALQERRDARMGVPNVPPQGAASPSAQRAIPSALAGGRSY